MATQFLLLLLLLTSTYLQISVSKVHSNYTDLESLLAFRTRVTDPFGLVAANWTTNTSFCNWIGVQCSHKRQRVIGLDLQGFSLRGSISPHIANLSFLSYLYLLNNSLSGPIPYGIGTLPRLTELNLYINDLTGPIPPSIFNMSSLVRISLADNNLTGPLPSSKDGLIMLPRVQFMALSKNQLTGGISGFTNCYNLQTLSLSANEFSGTIPAGLGNITGLSELHMVENYLTGTIPASIGNLTKLIQLEIGSNYVEGVIPKELGNLLNLQHLNLYNASLTGSIPISLLNASRLNFLQLTGNNLIGSIPDTLGKSFPLLQVLSLGLNQLTGGLDFITSLYNCRNLEGLVIAGNELEGVLPDSIGNLSVHLVYFEVQGNHIQGKIPAGLGNLSSLLTLSLRSNEFSGAVPSGLATIKTLQGLDLSINNITGIIPFQLGQMTSLNVLYLEENKLSGKIPDSLGNISGLQNLQLFGNKLSSTIPNSLCSLTGLLDLDLSGNTLHGSLPPQIGNLKSLLSLDLSKNSLSGNISSALEELQMLTHLDLSNNSFHGEIPQSLGKMVSISYMNLSYNVLSGTIPKSLASLQYLSSLDLSFNNLEGQIPQGGIFSRLNISSFIGNSALCGAPRLGFSTCPSSVAIRSSSRSKLHLLKYILPPVAFVSIMLSCFYLLLKFRRRTEPKSPSEVVTPNNHRVISYQELVHATENFNDANLLGKGSVSLVFRAKLYDGLIAAVKVMKSEVQGSLRSFDVECRVLGTVRHRNLAKIISICSNMEFKALILQFMPNGSLERWLHSPDHHGLNLLQRINIIVDVSLALEYLHHDHPDVILHHDLKPSNVLLDEDMIAHVGDFGIAKLLEGDCSSALSTSRAGTIGYMAPEYGSTGKFSRKCDVYSFGILVLETFTGKRPSDAIFDEGLTLRQWVTEACPGAILEIVDCNLLRENSTEKTPQKFHQQEEHTTVRLCLSSIIELGLMCSKDSPKERMLMKEVVPVLRKIKMDYLSKLPCA